MSAAGSGVKANEFTPVGALRSLIPSISAVDIPVVGVFHQDEMPDFVHGVVDVESPNGPAPVALSPEEMRSPASGEWFAELSETRQRLRDVVFRIRHFPTVPARRMTLTRCAPGKRARSSHNENHDEDLHRTLYCRRGHQRRAANNLFFRYRIPALLLIHLSTPS